MRQSFIGMVLGGVMTFASIVAGATVANAEGAACVSSDDVALTTINRVPPVYPVEAFNRNIEGFVTVMFDVTMDGMVENLRIVDQSPPRVFDRVALQAVQQWQYEPPVDQEGNAVRVCRERKRFTYNIDE